MDYINSLKLHSLVPGSIRKGQKVTGENLTHPLQVSRRLSLICARMFLAFRKDVRSLMVYTTTKPSAQSNGSSKIHLLSSLWQCGGENTGFQSKTTWLLKKQKGYQKGRFWGFRVNTIAWLHQRERKYKSSGVSVHLVLKAANAISKKLVLYQKSLFWLRWLPMFLRTWALSYSIDGCPSHEFWKSKWNNNCWNKRSQMQQL